MQPRIQLLDCPIKPYAWGSTTALPALFRAPPTGQPQAELWIGAHPDGPATVEQNGRGVSLEEVIAQNPAGWLGAPTAQRFGRLPLLLKVLAAAQPLSIQAHPTKSQAEAGFDREEAAGIPRGAPERSYKDRNHKPELIVAVSKFRALCGFRPVPQIVGLLAPLDLPALDDGISGLAAGGPLKPFYAELMTLPKAQREALARDVVQAAKRRREVPYQEVVALGERYPGDIGVLSPLLLNLLELAPDDALFLDAGELHAYLEGTGVELMASSDNVLRGGLTPKHVDVPELLTTLHFKTGRPTVLRPEPTADRRVRTYRTPVPDFGLSVIDLDAGPYLSTADSVELLLTMSGSPHLEPAHERFPLAPGRAAIVPAGAKYTLRGPGRVFRAFVPRS